MSTETRPCHRTGWPFSVRYCLPCIPLPLCNRLPESAFHAHGNVVCHTDLAFISGGFDQGKRSFVAGLRCYLSFGGFLKRACHYDTSGIDSLAVSGQWLIHPSTADADLADVSALWLDWVSPCCASRCIGTLFENLEPWILETYLPKNCPKARLPSPVLMVSTTFRVLASITDTVPSNQLAT